jgi:hypothetical protein
MFCETCGSRNEWEFPAEINIHLDTPENLDRPGLLVFPKLRVCLDCGFSRFTTPETGLWLLAISTAASKASIPRKVLTKPHSVSQPKPRKGGDL